MELKLLTYKQVSELTGVPGEPLQAGTLAEGPRGPVTISWRPQMHETPGCHTVTLLATHEFSQNAGSYWCPADPNDVDTLTWFAAVCDPATPGDCPFDDCPVYAQAARTYCEGLP